MLAPRGWAGNRPVNDAEAARLPVGDLTFSETIFALTQQTPYDFGVVTQLLGETDKRFHTGSMRNIYSPNVRCAQELVVDELARRMGGEERVAH